MQCTRIDIDLVLRWGCAGFVVFVAFFVMVVSMGRLDIEEIQYAL